MPRRSIPSYSHHKPSGQARVRLDGRDFYLGRYGSPESKREYSRLISEWTHRQESCPKGVDVPRLCLLYLEYAQKRYVKQGRQTSEIAIIRSALKFLIPKARNSQAAEVTPRMLRGIRADMIESGLARTTVNALVTRIRRMYRWAVSEEFVSPTVLEALKALPDLRSDSGEARETDPVKPVLDQYVDAIRKEVTPTVWAMIEVQRLTGMRPGEVIIMRGVDLTVSGEVWEYRPARHKNEHRKKERIVFLNEKAQKVLRPFLRPNLTDFLFSPSGGENRAYRRDTYSTAIARACSKANVPSWSPNQLRHNFATMARKKFGIEATRVLLGHSSAVTSEIYAEQDFEAARRFAAKIG